MSRLATTIARLHGAEQFQTIAGPEVGIAVQHDQFKALRASGTHPKFAEVQVWENKRGCVRKQRFSPPVSE